MKFGKGHHLHLIDGSAFIFRAYHALPPLTRSSDGLPIGAVSGFCNMLFRYIQNNTGVDAATHAAVIFDHSGKSFRNEIYKDYITNKAIDQSSRCSECGVPFCQVHCPLSNNIPDWLKLTAEGRLEEAYRLSQSTNNMPEVCGRICPQDRLCEGNCVIEQSGHGTVTIGSVEKFLTETAWENNWIKPIEVKNEINQSIGIIGAGPAGLACAEELRKKNYKVTVYDRYDRAGGLLIYGIPNFKLEKHVVLRRIKYLADSGIEFVNNFEVGKDKSFQELKEKHDAILIATGVYKSREIDLPGSE